MPVLFPTDSLRSCADIDKAIVIAVSRRDDAVYKLFAKNGSQWFEKMVIDDLKKSSESLFAKTDVSKIICAVAIFSLSLPPNYAIAGKTQVLAMLPI